MDKPDERSNGIESSVAGWRFLVPNLLTATSAGLGIASIVLSLEGKFILAAWAIVWCVLLDKVDGTAARLLKATSRFGTEFDSMADLVSFGLAPAILIYVAGRERWGIEPFHLHWWLLVAGCGIFALMTAIRLAKYNVTEHPPGVGHFSGIPTTICGAIVATGYLVAVNHAISIEVSRYFPVLLCLLGLGMVSTLPVPKVIPRRSRAFNTFQIANAIAVYVCGFGMLFPEYLLGLAVFFLSGGIFYGLLRPPSALESSTGQPKAAGQGR